MLHHDASVLYILFFQSPVMLAQSTPAYVQNDVYQYIVISLLFPLWSDVVVMVVSGRYPDVTAVGVRGCCVGRT